MKEVDQGGPAKQKAKDLNIPLVDRIMNQIKSCKSYGEDLNPESRSKIGEISRLCVQIFQKLFNHSDLAGLSKIIDFEMPETLINEDPQVLTYLKLCFIRRN